ncbi:penicillin-binding protein [Candidatus Saccharibacteria bacterium]|nr:penicillin-binding protein [Candidatus Saccharibacteria bacterium]
MANDKTARKTTANMKNKPAKAKASTPLKKRGNTGMSLYSNLAQKRRIKSDQKARKRAEEEAQLPKNPILRFFAKLRPDRFFKALFSKRGMLRLLKVALALVLIMVLAVGGLFLYYKKDLAAINPEELASRVQDTINTYLDRNGEVLWEDKGSGDYRLVVDGEDISSYMRKATVAIEDKNFYHHTGVDPTALVRAAWVTLRGGAVQGGSTLTQQLIKQVYFSDEAKDRSMSGIPRKIKEMILAIEIEKMYEKEEIITMYLNESPYGGRRNGVESAAQTYFKKSAKDLDLAESALLAAIPNNPAVYNPYNTAGNEALLERQHKVLNVMVEMGEITQEEADAAKAVDILARIQPEQSQYENIRAPWAVLEAKAALESKYGIKTLREGGFTIKTTIDLRAQNIAEDAVRAGAETMWKNGSDNACLVSIDVETGQVIAMVGSVDWNREGYGQLNAANSALEPGSSIKPILDYAPLFMEREGVNYGPGSILKDENIDKIYCGGSFGGCKLRNATDRFYGNITIRTALSTSQNIPAVKALYINGIEKSLDIAHKLGDKYYCANGETAGLSMAIGGGCSVKPIEHANAYATLSRGGVYKDYSYVLEVKNSSGDIIESWTDTEGERVVDPQVAYMILDILSDVKGRSALWGMAWATAYGSYSPHVKYALKTGTTENGRGSAKDSWVMATSPVVATAIWNGNHDGSPLSSDQHSVPYEINGAYEDRLHDEVYGADGKWYENMAWERPAGIQTLTVNGKTDIWPSWYNQSKSGIKKETMSFDSVSKKKATDCTPAETRVDVEVTKTYDPMSQSEVATADGYDTEADDDVHACTDIRPTVSVNSSAPGGTITASVSSGTHPIASYTLEVDGSVVKQGTSAGTISYSAGSKLSGTVTVKITARDNAGYTSTASQQVTISGH